MIEASRTVARRAFRRLGVGSAVASIAAGTTVGQVSLGVAVPLIAYLYSAADIGIFAILLGYGQIAAIVATARIEEVLPRLPSGRRWAAVYLVTRSTAMLAPIAAMSIASLAGIGWANPWHVIGLTLFVAALATSNLANYAVLATRDYRRAALQRALNGGITATAQVIGGLIAPSVLTLLFTYAIGNVAAALVSLPALRTIKCADAGEPNVGVVREERLVRFGLSVGSGALLSNLSLTLPLVAASMLFGNAAAGSFWLARRVLMTQTRLVATAVSDTTYAMSADSSPTRVAALVWSRLRKLRGLAVLLTAFGLIAAPVMSWITRDDHQDIAVLVLLLTAPAVLQFVTTSLSKVFLAMHMEHIATLWNAARLGGLLLVFWLSRTAQLGFLETVGVYALYMTITHAILLVLIARGAREFAAAPLLPLDDTAQHAAHKQSHRESHTSHQSHAAQLGRRHTPRTLIEGQP